MANLPTLSYFGITITLTANAVTNLLKALQAVQANVPAAVAELTIQNDTTSPAALLIGDATVATGPQQCGAIIAVGSSKTYRNRLQAVPLGRLFLRSTSAAVVNVEGWTV